MATKNMFSITNCLKIYLWATLTFVLSAHAPCTTCSTAHNSTCLPDHLICNFWPDCPNGTDEENCGESCDFDQLTAYEAGAVGLGPCSTWSLPLASDGTAGFVSHNALTSPDVGPKIDNTTRSEKGHFALFVSAVHDNGTSARVLSPWFGASGRACTVRFAYIMTGTHVGLLTLALETSAGAMATLWQQNGDNGYVWLNGEVHIGEMTSAFRLRFESVRGYGELGFMALDDIALQACDPYQPELRTCSLQEFRCETSVCIPRAVLCDSQNDCVHGDDENLPQCNARSMRDNRCTFESGTCGWQADTTSERFRSWKLHSGPTLTEKTGPDTDHTRGDENGHYMYVEADDGKMGDKFRLVSGLHMPPPPAVGDPSSPYFNACQLRFFYHMFGRHVLSLSVHIQEVVLGCTWCNVGVVPENGTCCGRFHADLWKYVASMDGANVWLRQIVPIPATKHPYRVIFEGIRGMRSHGDIAIDDISFSAECFGEGILAHNYSGGHEKIIVNGNVTTRFSFTPCGSRGAHGPTQYQCDTAYNDKTVRVLAEPGLAGIQVWTVPETTMYGVTVLGASGGTGVRNTKLSQGAYAHAKFNLTEGDEVYIVVGQQGQSACSSQTKEITKQICRHGILKGTNGSRSMAGGGGGGGGASYVFLRDALTGEFVPLIVAGGGGGKSFQLGATSIPADGGLTPPGPGLGAANYNGSAGGGGGWFPRQAGALSNGGGGAVGGWSLLRGALGGEPCPVALHTAGWETRGGFGGGGGACLAGGGGGGYTGGNVSAENHGEHNGQGGSSYIRPDGIDSRLEAGIHPGDGEVEIALIIDCPCDYLCIYTNVSQKEFKCFCKPNYVLAEDGRTCIDPLMQMQRAPVAGAGASPGVVAGVVSVAAGLLILLIAGVSVCRLRRRCWRAKSSEPPYPRASGLHLLSPASVPDHRLDRPARATTMGDIIPLQAGVTEVNPNYDFGVVVGGIKGSVHDLPEIPRHLITLSSSLGEGAFGVVYQGDLKLPSAKQPVAIKTLPALCSDQAEMDFLMEALIMRKFSHPNIVRLMGVCFNQRPWYIVLELLNGGDLRTFLRQCRPKERCKIEITTTELVQMAIDVAQGCMYLEENHFIHRDIAARNCLLTSKYGPDRVAKIADFGMARDIYRADYYRKGGKAMLPVKWMPPEAFLDGIFTSKTDIWSFGVLLWEVLSLGYVPYPGRTNQEVMHIVTVGGRLDPPENCPPALYHVMCLCWHGVAERRPTFSHILSKLSIAKTSNEVVCASLPSCKQFVGAAEDDLLMRPLERDTDDDRHMLLTVHKPAATSAGLLGGPDSPNSVDQLICPQSPDWEDPCPVTAGTQPPLPASTTANGAASTGPSSSSGRQSISSGRNAASSGKNSRQAAIEAGNIFSYDAFLAPAAIPHHQSVGVPGAGGGVGMQRRVHRENSVANGDSRPAQCVVRVLPPLWEATGSSAASMEATPQGTEGEITSCPEANDSILPPPPPSDNFGGGIGTPSPSSTPDSGLSPMSSSNGTKLLKNNKLTVGEAGATEATPSIVRSRPSPKNTVTTACSQLSLNCSSPTLSGKNKASYKLAGAENDPVESKQESAALLSDSEKTGGSADKMPLYENTALNNNSRGKDKIAT